MKLRNKDFDEIFEIIAFDYINSEVPNGNGDYPVEFIFMEGIDESGDNYEFKYKSLKDLNTVWEDYKPTEPLIKDKRTRKAVRVWAEVNAIDEVLYAERENRTLCLLEDMEKGGYSIEFVGWIPTLKDGEVYTIAELCGEEE